MSKQSRKFLLTVNNPKEKGLDIEKCLKLAQSLKGLVYACVSLEIGVKEHTPHIHMFAYYENPKSWDTVRKLIPNGDWECCRGSCQQNREYVFKLGKWIETEKGTTPVEGMQIEYGEMPEERACAKPQLALLLELIQQGYSDYQIITEYPEYMFDLSHIQRCRLTLRQEEYKNKWRNLEVTYIYGKTGAGKSRYVMETHGYENVFRVTDSNHPWDTYQGQDVVCFEEFASSFQIQRMLNYLDGYPLKLEARYSDKVACFNKVYIISNLPLEQQYPNVRDESREVWRAFLRRINKVVWYKSETQIINYNSVDEYLHRDGITGEPMQKLDF